MKKFIITMDTEGDNLWSWKPGDNITTENTRYLDRFQNLANSYGFKPVWLSNYEMLCDSRFIDFAKRVEKEKIGEIGMHLHAWNTPPFYSLPLESSGAPYLIEYPGKIMEDKIRIVTDIITETIGITPISHRAGRWAMNDAYVNALEKYGYKIDCSATPHIDWSKTKGQTMNSAGTDYTTFSETPFYWGNILEVPMTIKKSNHLFLNTNSIKHLASSCYSLLRGQYIWLRPNGHNLSQMKWLVRKAVESDDDYLMFMLHSSELMPGGSPTFKTNQAVENLYDDLVAIFDMISKSFAGITLREYYNNYTQQ